MHGLMQDSRLEKCLVAQMQTASIGSYMIQSHDDPWHTVQIHLHHLQNLQLEQDNAGVVNVMLLTALFHALLGRLVGMPHFDDRVQYGLSVLSNH